jgi:K+-transporting ATPase c subunit
MDLALVQKLIEDATEGPDLGILGEHRVNVLRLNLALDAGN